MKTVGSLIAVSGAVFVWSVRRGRVSQEVRSIAIGQALTLSVIGTIYRRDYSHL